MQKTAPSYSEKASNACTKYLTFRINGTEYGAHILKVREIIGYQKPTELPESASYVAGIITLRGHVIPVLDVKARLGLGKSEQGKDSSIIIVEKETDSAVVPTGLLVDSVSNVVEFVNADVDDVNIPGTEAKRDYIIGVGQSEGHEVMLLDIDCLLNQSDPRMYQHV